MNDDELRRELLRLLREDDEVRRVVKNLAGMAARDVIVADGKLVRAN